MDEAAARRFEEVLQDVPDEVSAENIGNNENLALRGGFEVEF